MLLKSNVELVQWLCAGSAWSPGDALAKAALLCRQVCPGHGLAHVLLSWDVLVLCSSFRAALTLGLIVGVWHFGLCLGRCERCREFDVISK